jgi:DNA-directed RNA polymerase beta subunit
MTAPTPILTDAASLRERVRAKAVSAVEAAFPLDMRERKLEVKDLRVVTKHYSPEEQRRALLTGGSLDEALKATLVLRGADGHVIDEAKNFTVVHLPYLTERHTLVADGNEYQVANQLRRKPGVYTARADNGELRAIFNLGRGKNFDLGFEPKNGTFHLAYGTTNIPLYPVLKALGVGHEKVVEHLGRGVADANAAAHGKETEKAIGKLYAKLVHPSVMNAKAPHEAKMEDVRRKLDQTTLDPHVTAATLGHGYDKVTPDALLAAAKKVLSVHSGKTLTDDTDALTFKTFHSLDDFLAERIRLSARAWSQKAKFALNGKTSVREALRPAPFSDAVRKFVTTSSLTAVPTGINPLELIDHAVKVTSLGEGGIPSDRAIPLDARMIHNTHFGALDPIRTPESGHSGVDIRATIAAHRDDQGNLYTVVKNVRTGKDDFIKAGDLAHHIVAFAGENLKGEVDAFVNGKVQRVQGSRVTHQMGHMAHAYSPDTTRDLGSNTAIKHSSPSVATQPVMATTRRCRLSSRYCLSLLLGLSSNRSTIWSISISL